MAQLVIALDLPSVAAARKMTTLLADSVKWFKIGLELFILGGPGLIAEIKSEGYKVFLDLKFYDIPRTVARAVAAAAAAGADMLTLHCQGGKKMCLAAREALADCENPPLLFGVTVLTSFAAGEMPGIACAPEEFAANLARSASGFGLDGVVCSGLEAARIKSANPSLLVLCPGIRPQGAPREDQARIVTPAQAAAHGADFLVVGRPVLASNNPLTAVKEILREMRNF